MAGTDINIYIDILDQQEGNMETLHLPILPSELSISSPSMNETVSTVKLGNITIKKMRDLRSLTIDSFFPAQADIYPFCSTNSDFKPPSSYINALEKAKEERLTCRLTVTGINLSAFYVTIEDFSWTFRQTNDVDYSLSMREYRPYGAKSKSLASSSSVFSEGETFGEIQVADAFGQKREPTGYAVGDKVIVNGSYYSTPDGLFRLLEPAWHTMTDPYTAARAVALQAWETSQMEPLVAAKCIIIDKYMDKVVMLPAPVIGDQPVVRTAEYPYCVADLDSRQTIGWVAEKQLIRM